MESVPLAAARTAVSNIEKLRANTHERRGFYEDAFSGESWVDIQEADFSDKPANLAISWYRPYPVLAESRPAAEHLR